MYNNNSNPDVENLYNIIINIIHDTLSNKPKIDFYQITSLSNIDKMLFVVENKLMELKIVLEKNEKEDTFSLKILGTAFQTNDLNGFYMVQIGQTFKIIEVKNTLKPPSPNGRGLYLYNL